MKSLDLKDIIQNTIKEKGGYFRPSGHRFILFSVGANREELEQLLFTQFSHLMGDVIATLALLPKAAEQTLLGPDTDPIRRGVERMTATARWVSGAQVTPDPTQLVTKQILKDAIDKAITRNIYELMALRSASGKNLATMPERLQRNRSLAEEAFLNYILGQNPSELDLLGIAKQSLDEVLEQPVGQRDPFSWMISGWINFCRDGYRDQAHNDFAQASLLSSKDPGPIFIEANRMMAWNQYLNGYHEAAYQTIQKIQGLSDSPEVVLDTLRYAVMAGREHEAITLFEKCSKGNPITLLALLGEQDLLARCGGLLTSCRTTMSQITDQALADLNAWSNAIESVKTLFSGLDCIALLPKENFYQFESLQLSLEGTDIFHAWWLSGEAVRGKEQLESQTIKLLQHEEKERSTYLARCEGQISDLNIWKNHAEDQVQANRNVKEDLVRTNLNLQPSDDRAANGTVAFMSLGCAGFGVYFILCMFVSSIAAIVGPNTGTGKGLMVLLILPIIAGFFITVTDGLRRIAAEAELERERTKLSAEQEDLVAEIRKVHKEKLKPLQEKEQSAIEALEQIQAALAQLLPPESESLPSQAA